MPEVELLRGWHVGSFYFVASIALGLVVRVMMAALRAFERKAGLPYWPTAWRIFLGESVASNDESLPLVGDYWHPFILGVFELCAYPILMITNNWTFIGAWLGFKSIAQWKAWSEHRVAFNRFLIGNALVLVFAFAVMVRLITLTRAG